MDILLPSLQPLDIPLKRQTSRPPSPPALFLMSSDLLWHMFNSFSNKSMTCLRHVSHYNVSVFL